MPTLTCVFYIIAVLLAFGPLGFVWTIWHEANAHDWKWISEHSRNMYVDGLKTMITASGIAVALLASSSVSSARTANSLIAASAKVAVICLITCVCISIMAIVSMLRGYERALSRYLEQERKQGNNSAITEGKLNTGELFLILVLSGGALSCFLVGFLFLGRIAFHF